MITCAYCSQPAVYNASSAFLYNGRDYGPVWYCDCQHAWVGCHKGTRNPLGRLANGALRKAKQDAHRAFDPLWKESKQRKLARIKAYAWLADQLGVARDRCHIGEFDVEQCRRVVEVCQQRIREAA